MTKMGGVSKKEIEQIKRNNYDVYKNGALKIYMDILCPKFLGDFDIKLIALKLIS